MVEVKSDHSLIGCTFTVDCASGRLSGLYESCITYGNKEN